VSTAEGARRVRLEARLKRLRQRGGLADQLGDGIARTRTHAMLVVERRRSVIVDRDDALRTIAVLGCVDHTVLDRWRSELHDPAWPGLPVFYVALDRDADGSAVKFAWEEIELPEPEGEDDDDNPFDEDDYGDS
jgi:hypothetical protein